MATLQQQAAANRRRNSKLLAGYAANPASIPKPTPFVPFKPYTPPRPPAGSYDPALDAARDAARRGLGDVRQDTALAGTRAAADFQLGQDDIGRSYGRGTFDLTRDRDRAYEDLDVSGRRGEEDYQRNVTMLRREYDILAGRQAESARTQGVLSAGLALKSAAARAANQGIAQQGLDTAIGRTREDIAQSRARVGQDFDTGYGRLGEDRDIGLGRLGLDYERGNTDRATGLARAGREDTAFGLDTAAQRAYQAAGAGYVPPGPGQPGGRPKNELANGNRRIVRGGMEYIVRPNGTVVSKKKVGR